MSHHVSKVKAIRSVLGRLGFHARPGDVVAALAEYGIAVSQAQVQKVRTEIVKNTSGIRREQARLKQVFPTRQVRHIRKAPESE